MQSRRLLSEQLQADIEMYLDKHRAGNASLKKEPTSLLERLQKEQASKAVSINTISNDRKWTMQMNLMEKHLSTMFQKHKMREWKSVIPTEKYPLPNEAVKKARNPHQFQRNIFCIYRIILYHVILYYIVLYPLCIYYFTS